MYARISTFEGDVKRFPETLREIREMALPGLREIDGFAGLISMIDHETGRSINLTLWDSHESLAESEDPTAMIRVQTTLPKDVQLVRVERYEVAEMFLAEMEQ
jgi:hypothetical protein